MLRQALIHYCWIVGRSRVLRAVGGLGTRNGGYIPTGIVYILYPVLTMFTVPMDKRQVTYLF